MKANILKVVWAAVLICIATPVLAQDILSIDELLGDPAIRHVELSPTGQHISAVVKNASGDDIITIVDVKSPDQTIQFSAGGAKVKWLGWATDDRLLAGVQASYGITLRANRVMALDRDGANQKVLLDDDTGITAFGFLGRPIVNRLADDPEHVLMISRGEDARELIKVNIETGATERVAEGKRHTRRWITDRSGEPILRQDIDDQKRQVTLYRREPESKRWSRMKRFRQKDGERSFDYWPLALSDNPDEYYVSVRAPGEDTYGIHLYDYKQDRLVRRVSSMPGIDIHNVVSTTGLTFLGSSWWEDRVVYDFEEARHTNHLKGLNAFFGEEDNVFVSEISDDGNVMLLHISGPRNPGAWFYYDLEARHVEPIAWLYPDLMPERFGRVEIVSYTARDGRVLKGYLTYPSNYSGGTAPLIVRPHGGPHARDYLDYDRRNQFLASRGFMIFQPQFRGSSGFGQDFESLGYGQWGGVMLDDIADSALHLVDQGLAEPGNICILGGSYGGFAALTSAFKYNDLYACAVSINGVPDLQELRDWDKEYLPDDSYEFMLTSMGPSSGFSDWSATQNVARIDNPVLVVYGTRDYRVYADYQSIPFIRAMQAAGKDVDVLELRGAGHSIRGDGDIAKFYTALEGFLARHLTGHRAARIDAAEVESLSFGERLEQGLVFINGAGDFESDLVDTTIGNTAPEPPEEE